MLNNATLRKNTRIQLKENWGEPILVGIVNFLFLFVISFISSIGRSLFHMHVIITITQVIVILLITGPITIGINVFSLKFKRGERPGVGSIFDGFKFYGPSLGLYLWNKLWVLLWSLLLIVPGIIKGLSYSMSYYILADNPNVGVRNALNISKRMTKGYKGKLFLLGISFFGWGVLSVISLGIGFLWLSAYIRITLANFYDEMKNECIEKGVCTAEEFINVGALPHTKNNLNDEDSMHVIIDEQIPETEDVVFKKLKLRGLPIWLFIGLLITLIILAIMRVNYKNPYITNLMELIPYVIAFVWLLKKKRQNNIELKAIMGSLPRKYKWWKLLPSVIVIILFSYGAAIVLNYCLSYLAPQYLLNHYNEPKPNTSFFNKSLKMLIIVFIAPFVEELFFRGLMLHRFSIKWNINVAIILSSLIFGILHFNFIGIFVFGLLMCIVYLKTRCLFLTMIIHSLNNAFAESITLLFSRDSKATTIDNMRSPIWIGVVLMVITGPILVQYIYRNWPKKGYKLPYYGREGDRHRKTGTLDTVE